MNHIEFTYKTYDELDLYAQGWIPNQDIKGVILLVHGLGEHGGRYRVLGMDLCADGYALITYDFRGHGKSDGPRGHTPSYTAWLNDINGMLQEIRCQFYKQKIFLYGHSLGGNQVLNYILRENPDVVGAIVTSPALQVVSMPAAWKFSLAVIANLILPIISLPNGLDLKYLSHNPDVVSAYENDPLTHDKISARAFISFFEAGKWAIDHASLLSIPLLLMHGVEDKITSPAASEDFAKKAGDICSLKLWDDSYHELHNELNRDDIVQTIVKWLDTISLK